MNEPQKTGFGFLYPNPYHTHHCSVHICEGYARWYVGNPSLPHVATYALCDKCARNLVNKSPLELIEGERDLRTEIETEIGAKVEEIKAQHETEIQQLYKTWSAQKAEVVPVLAPLPFEEKPQEQPLAPINEGIFRCLDCDKEFDNKRALSNHMRIHEGVKA